MTTAGGSKLNSYLAVFLFIGMALSNHLRELKQGLWSDVANSEETKCLHWV